MGPIIMVQAVKEVCFAFEDETDRCVTSKRSEDLISSIVHILYLIIKTSLLMKEDSGNTNIITVSKYRLFMYF